MTDTDEPPEYRCPDCKRPPSEAQTIHTFARGDQVEIAVDRCPHACHTRYDQGQEDWDVLREERDALRMELSALRSYTGFCVQGLRAAYGEGFTAGFGKRLVRGDYSVDTGWEFSRTKSERDRIISEGLERGESPALFKTTDEQSARPDTTRNPKDTAQ